MNTTDARRRSVAVDRRRGRGAALMVQRMKRAREALVNRESSNVKGRAA